MVTYARKEVVFSQGDPCDSVMYLRNGGIQLSVLSHAGKEAVIATLGPGDFLGEGALAGQPVRLETATATMATTVLVVPKRQMIRLLHSQRAFSDRFIAHMLMRNARLEADLVDQLFNSSEKRLARTLLLLARYGHGRKTAGEGAENLSGNARRNGRDHPVPRELLHEQVQEARFRRIQRRPQGQSFASDGRRP